MKPYDALRGRQDDIGAAYRAALRHAQCTFAAESARWAGDHHRSHQHADEADEAHREMRAALLRLAERADA